MQPRQMHREGEGVKGKEFGLGLPDTLATIFKITCFFVPCLDIDECSTNSHNCDVNAVCNNTQGSYNCTCKPRYTGNGWTCRPGKLIIWFFLLLRPRLLPLAHIGCWIVLAQTMHAMDS